MAGALVLCRDGVLEAAVKISLARKRNIKVQYVKYEAKKRIGAFLRGVGPLAGSTCSFCFGYLFCYYRQMPAGAGAGAFFSDNLLFLIVGFVAGVVAHLSWRESERVRGHHSGQGG